VVDKALANELDALKERVIGREVFGRPADFETAGDAIVRVKANEVRKRLAQYYLDGMAADTLRIDLPAGSYIPTITWLDGKEAAPPEAETPEPAAPPAEDPPKKPWRVLQWSALAGCLLVAGVVITWRLLPSTSDFERFWAPMFETAEPVVVCIPANDRYLFPARLNEALSEAAKAPNYHLDLELGREEVARVPSGQMSVQNFRAVLSLATFLAQRGRQAQFRTPEELSADEIRHRAVIFVGAYHNPWAMQLSQELRYRFESRDRDSREVCWIRDRDEPAAEKWKVEKQWPYGAQAVDYAIISRVFDSANGRVIVSAAGMNSFGTQVAGEFLTVPNYWKAVAAKAPKGWQQRNWQIVLETRVIGTTPGPPKILTMHVW
jgi:hypothetical protein